NRRAQTPRRLRRFLRTRRPQILVVRGQHLGALVVQAPDVDRVVRAVELTQRAAGALAHLDHRDGGGDAADPGDAGRRALHGDAVERTGVDAIDAADALLELHERLRALLRL